MAALMASSLGTSTSTSFRCGCNKPAVRPAAQVARRGALHVVAAKPTKAAEFRSLSDEQIAEEVNNSKRALFDLRVKQKTKQEFKSSDFGWHQTKIAQLLTVKREREAKQGVTKRQARAEEKKRNVQEGFAQF